MKASTGRVRIGAIAILAAGAFTTLVFTFMVAPRVIQAQSAQPSYDPPHHIFSSTPPGSQVVVHPSPASQQRALTSGAPLPISGTWVPLNHQPTFGPESIFLLTDGRILAQDGNRTDIGWWTLTPDNTGSYINGNWTQVASPSNCPNGYPGQSASTMYSPLYYGSAVLPDGRFVVIGGEYNYNYNYPTGGSGGKVSNETWTDQGAIYDPVANSWTCITAPTGWIQIGDAETAVLPDGTFLIADPFSNAVDTLDVTTNPPTFNSPFTPSGKSADGSNDEEGWELLPDGTVLTLQVNNAADTTDTPALVYDNATEEWTTAGTAPDVLVFNSIQEIGPALLRPDGTVFAEGATGFNDIYDTLTGTWSSGPVFPTITESYSAGMCTLTSVTEQFAAVDAPSALLPDGNVLAVVSPYDTTPNCGWITPTEFFEFDGTNLTKVNAPPNAPNDVSFNGRLLVLPTGQILWTDGSKDVEIYKPMGSYNPSWAPTIMSSPIQVAVGGANYPIAGTQFNGLSQAVSYGDDYQGATNYPLVRITNNATGHIFYTRTHGHSTMGVATGIAVVGTEFDVPVGIETGPSTLVVVANGIPSQPAHLLVGNILVNDLEVVPGSEKVQLVHSSSPQSDELNMSFKFIDFGPPFPACGAGTDAFNFLEVELEEGTCASLPGFGRAVGLSFVQRTVGGKTYGTDNYTAPGQGGGSVSARMLELATPSGACGEWTLNLEQSGLDLTFDDIAGGNPFALVLEDGNGNLGCFDVTNAIVGNQIDPPKVVRRGARR